VTPSVPHATPLPPNGIPVPPWMKATELPIGPRASDSGMIQALASSPSHTAKSAEFPTAVQLITQCPGNPRAKEIRFRLLK
jgi:hypothetical protein